MVIIADDVVPVALDLMGGDRGADVVLQGALKAVVDDGDRVIAVGVPALGERIARDHAPLVAAGRLAFVGADDVVTMDDQPAAAVRSKRRSSMRVACELVQQGRCSAVLSTGNSGAFSATASFVFGRLPGVARPAIAALVPSLGATGHALLLDAGAQVACTPLHLAQWGVLGSAYFAHSFGVARPAVGVLGNGEEDHKGTALTRAALALLRQTQLRVTGPCEGRDLLHGGVDVVVTDGFTGNVALKTAEGVVAFLGQLVKNTFTHGSVVDRLGGALSRPGWDRIRASLDPRETGAAPLLGLRRPAFVAHGQSDAYAVRCGLRAARRFVALDVEGALATALARNPVVRSTRLSPTAP
ncbi:MAG: phosphate acyltransferase PlsX [Deltaproteobacteria bacterium]|nr:phosphate acyltransferase PlsX [Deltaproteobacteria bacterium]